MIEDGHADLEEKRDRQGIAVLSNRRHIAKGTQKFQKACKDRQRLLQLHDLVVVLGVDPHYSLGVVLAGLQFLFGRHYYFVDHDY